MSPRGHSMIGVGRTVRGDQLVEYQFIVLREQEGQLAYQAHPSGQPSAKFLSKTVSDAEVVFENPAHDFPQRVGYRRDGPDALLGVDRGNPERAGAARGVSVSPRDVPGEIICRSGVCTEVGRSGD